MINRYSVLGSTFVFLVAILISIGTLGNTETLSTCVITSVEWSLEDTLEFDSSFDPINDVAFQGVECGKLKSGACSMRMRKRLKCRDSGI